TGYVPVINPKNSERKAIVIGVSFSLSRSYRPATVAAKPPDGGARMCLDTYMPRGVCSTHGICVRNHCGAEPPRDLEPSGFVTAIGWRDRAPASDAAADRVQAPASAARGRFRRSHGGRTAPSLSAEA